MQEYAAVPPIEIATQVQEISTPGYHYQHNEIKQGS